LIVLLREVWGDPRKRRQRLELLAVMLEAARDGVNKTQIMYVAGLSFAQLTEYLSFLVRMGLLEASKGSERLIYKTTVKGKLYVKAYEEIKHLLHERSAHEWKKSRQLTNFFKTLRVNRTWRAFT
jgi:predicted transcriptional regulator